MCHQTGILLSFALVLWAAGADPGFAASVSDAITKNDAILDEGESQARGLPLEIARQVPDAEPLFLAEFRFEQAGLIHRVRIATGGNFYSWKVDQRELMPPQADPTSQWVDEVFQLVLAESGATTVKRAGGHPFFIHQAGTYRAGRKPDSEFLYSPALRVHWDEEEQELYILSWPQQAHIPTPLRSEVLILSRWRRVAPATLEHAVAVLNFGAKTIDFINLPWGGVRHSLLAQLEARIRSPAWERIAVKLFAPTPVHTVTESRGLLIWSEAGEDPSRLALGLAFPGRIGGEATHVRSGTAAATRDYYVGDISGRIRLATGNVLIGKYLIAAGRHGSVRPEISEAAQRIPSDTTSLALERVPGETCLSPVTAGASSPSPTTCAIAGTLRLFTDAKPLFGYRDADGRALVVSDPYFGIPAGRGLEVWNRRGALTGLLGFARRRLQGAECGLPQAVVCESAND